MPSQTNFEYDVFISYSSRDRTWASALNDKLMNHGLNPFLDRERLQAGEYWEPQLNKALAASRHLVVLWSNNARESDWVTNEIYVFKSITTDDSTYQPVAGRRLIVLALEGENRALAKYHNITDIKKLGAYHPEAEDKGFNAFNPTEWQDVIDKVLSTMDVSDQRIPVNLAILTLKKEEWEEIDETVVPRAGVDSLATVLQKIGVGTKAELMEKYENERRLWQPFGSTQTVNEVLTRLLEEVNKRSVGKKYRWEPIDDAFWSNDIDARKSQVRKLRDEPSVIVVDPLALYSAEVKDRLTQDMVECFNNRQAIILVLAPFSLPAHYSSMRQLIESMANLVSINFFEKPVEMGSSIAYCSPNIGDEKELKRWLLRAIRSEIRTRPRHDYLGVEGGEA